MDRSTGSAPPVCVIAADALRMRSTHPEAPAADILDLVAAGRPIADLMAAADLASAGPASHFGALVTDAIDPLMTAKEWAGLIAGCVDASSAAAMLQAWKTEVVERLLPMYQPSGGATRSRAR